MVKLPLMCWPSSSKMMLLMSMLIDSNNKILTLNAVAINYSHPICTRSKMLSSLFWRIVVKCIVRANHIIFMGIYLEKFQIMSVCRFRESYLKKIILFCNQLCDGALLTFSSSE